MPGGFRGVNIVNIIKIGVVYYHELLAFSQITVIFHLTPDIIIHAILAPSLSHCELYIKKYLGEVVILESGMSRHYAHLWPQYHFAVTP